MGTQQYGPCSRVVLIAGSFMQKMSNLETKSVFAIDREVLFQGGLKHSFDCRCIIIGSFSKSPVHLFMNPRRQTSTRLKKLGLTSHHHDTSQMGSKPGQSSIKSSLKECTVAPGFNHNCGLHANWL